jgi:prephenate dehydrogenase
MWAEILMENRVAVAESVAESIGVLQDVQASLISGDHRAIREWLVEANSLHKSSRTFDHSSDIVS